MLGGGEEGNQRHFSSSTEETKDCEPTCHAEDVHAHVLCVQTEEEEIESKKVPGLPMDWIHETDSFENVILLISIQPVNVVMIRELRTRNNVPETCSF